MVSEGELEASWGRAGARRKGGGMNYRTCPSKSKFDNSEGIPT